MDHLGQFISNHWGLWTLLIVVLVSIFINERLLQKTQGKKLSPEALVALLNEENAIVIDLRDQESYRRGHIINAIHAEKDAFQQQKMDKYKTKTVVLVCNRGIEAAALAAKLRAQGFTNPLVLAGGIEAWRGRDLPLIKGK